MCSIKFYRLHAFKFIETTGWNTEWQGKDNIRPLPFNVVERWEYKNRADGRAIRMTEFVKDLNFVQKGYWNAHFTIHICWTVAKILSPQGLMSPNIQISSTIVLYSYGDSEYV